MFEKLELLPPDPILGLTTTFKNDPNPAKVNLGVGVYKDETGNTPIFEAIKAAEKSMLEKQTTKAYVPQAGEPEYLEGITKLVLGDSIASKRSELISAAMTPGGSGALRMLAGLVGSTGSDPTVWASNPTWGNHFPLLESAGLKLEPYPYYDGTTGLVNFEAMMSTLEAAKPGDVLLLHGCCHNPTGADLSQEQWQTVISFANEKQLLPFIDLAYQGLGDGLEEDVYGIRLAVQSCPETMIAVSSSKTFGVYRERAGVAIMTSRTSEDSEKALTNILSIARRTYSMSASHGAATIGELLSTPELKSQWENEINVARKRMVGLREEFVTRLNGAQDKKDFSFVSQNKGMFSILGLSLEQVLEMREKSGIYLINSSRISIAGLTDANLDGVVKSIVDVL